MTAPQRIVACAGLVLFLAPALYPVWDCTWSETVLWEDSYPEWHTAQQHLRQRARNEIAALFAKYLPDEPFEILNADDLDGLRQAIAETRRKRADEWRQGVEERKKAGEGTILDSLFAMAPGTDEACVTHETLDAALEILNTPIEPEPDPEPGLQQHEMTGPRRAWLLSGPPRISESDREGEATIVDQLPEDSFAEHVRRRQERANPSVWD